MDDERRKNNRVYPTKYLISYGTIEGGFKIYGPFNMDSEAKIWADKNLMDEGWTVVPFSLTPHMYTPFEEIISNQLQTIGFLEAELATDIQ